MRHILIADDYSPFLEDMKRMFSAEDTSVLTVATSGQALLEISNQQFDLVITDLLMETQTAADGFAVIRAAKENKFTQVIVVTSFGKPELSVESMRLGAFDYLEKATPGTNFRAMLVRKAELALDYQAAKRAASEEKR